MQSTARPKALTDETPRPPSSREGGLGIGKSKVGRMSAGARCANSFHRCGGPPPSKREVFGEGNCNGWLHHCNGWMHLQPSVAPSYTVGARIARPFVPDVITTTLREGARRVIGATAKPLYPIDGKAAGFDRRNPKTSLFEGGGPPAGGGRSPRAVEGVRGRWKESAEGGRSPRTVEGVRRR